jgi:phage shock protein E
MLSAGNRLESRSRMNNTILLIVVSAAAALLLIRVMRPRKVPASVVLEKIRAGARVIDVRSSQEFAGSSYPKARNIPVDVLPSRLDELPRDKPIVLYCASGARSARAARILKQAGFTDVTNAGGLGSMPRQG